MAYKRTIDENEDFLLFKVPKKIREFEQSRNDSDKWNVRWDKLCAKSKHAHQLRRLVKLADKKLILENAKTAEMSAFNAETQNAIDEYSAQIRNPEIKVTKKINSVTVTLIISVLLFVGYVVFHLFF